MTKTVLIVVVLILCSLHFADSFCVPWRSTATASHASSASVSRLHSTSADEDWRAFRARLVLRNNTSNTVKEFQENEDAYSTTSTSSSWAYDAGLHLEKGSIVLSRVEFKLAAPVLDQPFFHKCVVLIVEHDDEMTQGIILNRPTDLRLDSQENIFFGTDPDESSSAPTMLLEEFAPDDYHNGLHHWRLFFGGEIEGLDEDDDDQDEYDNDEQDDLLIVCLHNIASLAAQQVSEEIVPGVYMTSNAAARSLVESGEATPDAFYAFYGFCGWDPDQLQMEVQNGSWYLASTDPQTLWDDLAVMRNESYDARAAGLQMWDNLIQKLGKQNEVGKGSPEQKNFSDLMLKEWVTQTLTNIEENGSGNGALDDASIFRALHAADRPSAQAGSLLRGSSLPDSPFLLKDQFLHKSTVLLLQEDEEGSMGMILNLPTTNTLSLQINNSTFANFTIRFGGPSYFVTDNTNEDAGLDGLGNGNVHEENEEGLVWLHCCAGLKYLRTGKPLVIGDENGVWTCIREQVATSIDLGFASVDDFMLVKGFCLWEKESESGGIKGQVMSGNLETVAPDKIDAVWTTLRRQHHLNKNSFRGNFGLGKEAWMQAAADENTLQVQSHGSRLVFGSKICVEELADRALITWMKIHLFENDTMY